jgi:hypothetical protein
LGIFLNSQNKMMMVEGQTCCSGGSRLRISRVTDDGEKEGNLHF